MKLELQSFMQRFGIALISLVIIVFCLVKSRLVSKILDTISASNAYKKWFAQIMVKNSPSRCKVSPEILALKDAQFKAIEDKVLEVGGDVMEIGAGSGRSLEYLRLPEGSSLVVVDYNPFMEKHFRESLAKAPHIKLKDYLVQSAADMSNIPDNSFAAVFTTDVMCSLSEDDLRKMLKEVKRILKPDGCLFFMEHVLDVPGTWRRTIQRLVCSQIGIWPRLLDNCHCDRETWQYIQETGFSSVIFKYTYIPNSNLPSMVLKAIVYCIRRFMIGYAKK